MLADDGRLQNFRTDRPAGDAAARCMIDLIRDARLATPAGGKYQNAFFDYSFAIY